MIIGSHCKMSAKDFLLGSVNEALSYDANALMIYTGAPQNTMRRPVKDLKVKEATELLAQNNIPMENMIAHAPYIINLANCVNASTFELATTFLEKEIARCEEIGLKYLVLHPGSFTTATFDKGINKIVEGLNMVLKQDQKVTILLETMSGKGSEVGYEFEHLKYIMDNTIFNQHLAICLDTCHIHDAGYDLNDFDTILNDFDKIIGLDKLKVMHINDSKNEIGARKDRHANIGDGFIGFKNLHYIVNHEKLENVIKILETPYIDEQAPYKAEIALLKSKI